jgi:hypothetical protein
VPRGAEDKQKKRKMFSRKRSDILFSLSFFLSLSISLTLSLSHGRNWSVGQAIEFSDNAAASSFSLSQECMPRFRSSLLCLQNIFFIIEKLPA